MENQPQGILHLREEPAIGTEGDLAVAAPRLPRRRTEAERIEQAGPVPPAAGHDAAVRAHAEHRLKADSP